jgi:hypothetical protein
LTLQAWIQAVYNNDPATAGARLWMEPYEYLATFTAFNGVSGNASQVIQINAVSDFFCTRIAYQAGLGTVQTVGSMPIVQARLQVTDTGSGNQFFNAPVMLENVAAHAYFNQHLPMPRYCAANTSLNVQLTAAGTGAETFSFIDVTLEGVRVRKFSNGVNG